MALGLVYLSLAAYHLTPKLASVLLDEETRDGLVGSAERRFSERA